MPLEFIGLDKKQNEAAKKGQKRWITGMYEFDRSFRHRTYKKPDRLGVPIEIGWELMGQSQIGKSTIAHSFAQMLAQTYSADSGYVLIETEKDGFEKSAILDMAELNGFDAPISIANGENHAKMLQEGIDYVKNGNMKVCIYDSVAATIPTAQENGELGDANMGRQAILVNHFVERVMEHTGVIPEIPCTFIFVNHYKPKIGSNAWYSPGGSKKNYLCRVVISFAKSGGKRYPSGGRAIIGTVRKNTFGGGEKDGTPAKKGEPAPSTFPLFILPEYGIHIGLTNLYTCVERLKLIKGGAGYLQYEGEKLSHKMSQVVADPSNFDFSIVDDALAEYEKGKL